MGLRDLLREVKSLDRPVKLEHSVEHTPEVYAQDL